MNFVLTAQVLAHGSLVRLSRLWGVAIDRRHRIQIPEDAEPAWRRWRTTLDLETQEEVDAALQWSDLENAKRPSSVVLTVTMKERSSWPRLELTLDDALDLAYRPFRLFLENAASDGGFFQSILTADERQWFDDWVRREWLLLETAGGVTELKKRVEWARQDPSRQLRVAALFDGDAVEPAVAHPESAANFRDRLHPNSRKVLDACEAVQAGDHNAFPHHVTRRRSIENYLPLATLERWAASVEAKERPRCSKRVGALRAFPHRHHVNMKDGHEGDRKRKPPITWLPAAKRTPLEQGFGKRHRDVVPARTQ